MNDFAQITALLVAQAPRQQAQHALTLLVARTRARAGALLKLSLDGPALFASCRDLKVAAIDRACALYDAHHRPLRAGRPVRIGSDVVAPILRGDRLTAVLYLDAPQTYEPDALVAFSITFLKAIEADELGAELHAALGDASGESSPTTKQRLLILLEQNEWNVARVSREMGVTRRTIYMRMRRYGIERKRVPRSNTLARKSGGLRT